MRRNTQRTRNEHGIVLMLSLLLIAALTAAGIGASVIIVTEFQATKSTDQGIKAFYTADIGMERALYTIFNNRLVGTRLGTGSGDTGSTFEQVYNSGSGLTLTGGADVSLQDTTVTTTTKTLPLIRKNQTAQVDLYDPDDPFGYSTAPRTITLQRSALTTEDLNGVGAEVQWVYALALAGGRTFTENSTIKLLSNGNLAAGVTIDLFTGNLSGNDNAINPPGITLPPTNPAEISGWVVRIKALNNDLPNLQVNANLVDGSAYDITSDLYIQSRGQYRDASFVLSGAVPWRLPTVGVFDYVIFSEKTLDKPG